MFKDLKSLEKWTKVAIAVGTAIIIGSFGYGHHVETH